MTATEFTANLFSGISFAMMKLLESNMSMLRTFWNGSWDVGHLVHIYFEVSGRTTVS